MRAVAERESGLLDTPRRVLIWQQRKKHFLPFLLPRMQELGKIVLQDSSGGKFYNFTQLYSWLEESRMEFYH